MRAIAALAVAVSLALTGCASEDRRGPGLASLALDLARARLGKGTAETAGTPSAPAITRAQMEALGRPVIYVDVPRLGRAQPAVEVARNGDVHTFMSGDQTTFSLRHGVIVATRGLPVDLFTQELSIPEAELFRGDAPRTYRRVQRHLTGAGELQTREYACAIAPMPTDEQIEVFGRVHRVRQFTELCKNRERAFKNSYWVERPRGVVWQSHQSVSQPVGHVIVQQVVD